MAFPLPLALGAAAVAAYLLLAGDSAKSATPPPQPSSQSMPDALKKAYDDLLANGQDPDALEKVATELEKYGFTAEAAQLRARAAELRKKSPSPLPSPPSPTPSPVPVPAPLGTYATVTAPNGVHVRTQPNENSADAGALLVQGTKVLVLSSGYPATSAATKGWTKVTAPGGYTGYITTEWLSAPGSVLPLPSPSPLPQPTPAAVYTAVVTAPSGLRVRSQPNENSAEAGAALPTGTTVTVLKTGLPATAAAPNGWTQITAPGGYTGYCSTQWLSFNSVAPPTVSGRPVFAGSAPRYATMVAPSGAKLRVSPSASSPSKTIVENGARVRILQALTGPKAEHQSPGPGGWSCILYNGVVDGWVPSEWLVIS